MNKRNSMLAVAMVALPTLAMSQSSVELYGRLDLSVNYQKYDSTATVPSSSRYFVTSDTSWLGFRGVEDLGRGLSAYFHIEHGFNADTGAQTAPVFWNRETYVGLRSTTLGSVQLGSQFTEGIWLTKAVDPFRRAGEGAIFPMFQQPQGGALGVPVAVSNAAQYISPNLGGLVAKVLVATSEGGAATNGVALGHSESIGLDYTWNRLFVGATYDHARSAAGAAAGPLAAYVGAMQTTYQAGATYRFDFLKLHGYYYRATVEGVNGAANPPGAKGAMLGVSVPVGSGEVAATVIRKTTDDAANSRGQLVAVQYKYFLSKRTSLYAAAAHESNTGNASYGIWPARQDVAATTPPTYGAAVGQNVKAVSFGINHFF